VTNPASAGSAWTAPAQLTQWAQEALRQAAGRDRRFEPDAVIAAVRTVVAAWVLAADGDGSRLAGLALEQTAQWLISPAMESWLVGPAPLITQIEVRAFVQPAGQPPQLRVRFDFDGRQRFAAESQPPVQTSFVAVLELAFASAGPHPWLVRSGHVGTLDKFLGYQFTSRHERAGEYRERTGSLAPDAAIRPAGRYKILARFADHDERFSSWAETEVVRAAPPSRTEAEQLIWPAVDAETARALGPGDWRPSLLYIDLIELAGEDHEPEAPTASVM
jgi:hypothetical protein